MSNTEDSTSQVHKRELDQGSEDNNQPKKLKTEVTDDQLNDIFDGPIPGLNSNDTGLGDFDAIGSNQNLSSNNIEIDFDNLPANILESTNTNGFSNTTDAHKSGSQTPGLQTPGINSGVNTVTSNAPTPKPYTNIDTSRKGTPMGNETYSLNDTNDIKGNIKTEPYQSVPINRMNPLVQQAHGIQGLNTSNIDRPSSSSNNNAADKRPFHTNDPSKLNDAIAAAGVDIQHEEEMLMQNQLNLRQDVTREQKLLMRSQKTPSFLNSYHVASFMNKIAKENGVTQNFLEDPELLELMSASCENWLSHIITKTIILSRHRRRGIPNLNSKGKQTGSIQRSELSKELRNLANKQKELEEKRVNKRIILGLESGIGSVNDDEAGSGKAGAEETLHRAANATAAMMTMNPGRKKYSWMTANSNSTDDKNGTTEKSTAGKQSSIISVRGDNGLRYREIRSGNSVTMKDLLGAIEDERMGTEKAVLKGYAKLKD